MIYYMPIDECPHCGARTPRIFSHRCREQEENGHVCAEVAGELQSWIASQVAAGSARLEPPSRSETDLHGAIRSEPALSTAAKSHLIGLVDELCRAR